MFILGWIIFGALTGWLASKIVNKRGEGCGRDRRHSGVVGLSRPHWRPALTE
jgi:uncharacterized membrane protein YeaQ/YmgE (transglycosylase-associated protein family)